MTLALNVAAANAHHMVLQGLGILRSLGDTEWQAVENSGYWHDLPVCDYLYPDDASFVELNRSLRALMIGPDQADTYAEVKYYRGDTTTDPSDTNCVWLEIRV